MSVIEEVAPLAPLTRRTQDDIVGPITEREWRARTLEAAALEINVNGWASMKARRDDGSICIGGAIALALGHDVPAGVTAMGLAVWAEIHDVWGAYGVHPGSWNDGHCQGAEDAAFVLRLRGEEIRDGR